MQHNRRIAPFQETRVTQDGHSKDFVGVSREYAGLSKDNNTLPRDKLNLSRDGEVATSRENNPQSGQKVSNLRMSSFTPETCV